MKKSTKKPAAAPAASRQPLPLPHGDGSLSWEVTTQTTSFGIVLEEMDARPDGTLEYQGSLYELPYYNANDYATRFTGEREATYDALLALVVARGGFPRRVTFVEPAKLSDREKALESFLKTAFPPEHLRVIYDETDGEWFSVEESLSSGDAPTLTKMGPDAVDDLGAIEAAAEDGWERAIDAVRAVLDQDGVDAVRLGNEAHAARCFRHAGTVVETASRGFFAPSAEG